VKDLIYRYDRDLYNRSFLNCYQRQSLVMLGERVTDLHLLFYNCLISTDDILEQVIRLNRPKYDAESRLFEPDALARIGITRQEMPVDTYADAKPVLVDSVCEAGYALLVIDVFYLPHCPEYRAEHVVHTIILKGYAHGEWSIVDDNPASLLCEYTYPEHVIAAAYDNNQLRRVRSFSIGEYDAEEAGRAAGTAFSELVQKYEDGGALLSSVDEVLACPWIAPERAVTLLHNAFSFYQGSRTCLLEYLRRGLGDPEIERIVGRIVQQGTAVQNQLLVGKVTGFVDATSVKSTCLDLKDAEQELVHRLRR
jgi:hypothetical protein